MAKTLSLEVSDFVSVYMDEEAMVDCLEAEALKRYYRQCSHPLSAKEKELRAFLGREGYKRLTPIEKERMLACIELPK